ncbi:GFA family protein [Aspergillus clavatus NRRL 1]|uniref:DUF636 domain protein n=1 Tax=Aspergillus clavatus (strain ATCC 1007 / CBS 513.65 / DSM 816 / NCTC 3887 / NRRL 1 / QM 1276 / 107) TaxID=344612 RepID=A1CA48_ASPCL|nr:DUF636 domain protein [Aspergillus clavatus NRRL 1]EAW12616.1 DUF636 domain protein [Aspergillus clavatus NRRL 1]
MASLTGSCACHHITYTTTQPPQDTVNCHCTTCRKLSGGPFQSWTSFPLAAIVWNTEPTFRRSSDVASRGFCPKCGASMAMKYDYESGHLSVTTGTIDETLRSEIPKPSRHLFVREKAAWFDLPDDEAERVDGFTPEMIEGLNSLQRKSN